MYMSIIKQHTSVKEYIATVTEVKLSKWL